MLVFLCARVLVLTSFYDVSVECSVHLNIRSKWCLMCSAKAIQFELVFLDDCLFHFGVSKLTFVIMVLTIEIQEIWFISSLLHKCKNGENPNISWSLFQQIIIIDCSCARVVVLTSLPDLGVEQIVFCEPDPKHEVPYKSHSV